jgi:hypothetical protein
MTGEADSEVLQGGVANAGAVVRIGDVVFRPANDHSPTIHALLRHVRAAGFDGVPDPLAIDPDGRERLSFIAGEVAFPPFPRWSQTDLFLASTASLLRRFHDATAGFVPPAGATWSDEMADDAPSGSHQVFCHNDVCPENVVCRGGEAIALLDFDFAAPGRRVFDLASLAIMCVPIEPPENAAQTDRGGLDPFVRLRLVADAYGLPPGRDELIDVVGMKIARGGEFVQRRVDAGEEAFIKMWHEYGGMARYDRRRAWFATHRQHFTDAVR